MSKPYNKYWRPGFVLRERGNQYWNACIDSPTHGAQIQCYGRTEEEARALRDMILARLNEGSFPEGTHQTFAMGQRVTKTKGSSWTGRVAGYYSTTLTPEGYAVESENEPGSVQIYPGGALKGIE